jgi:hypothetical protein
MAGEGGKTRKKGSFLKKIKVIDGEKEKKKACL